MTKSMISEYLSKMEDNVTTVLYSLFKVKYLRKIILDELLNMNSTINDIEFEDITRNKKIDDVGRPDICIRNKNNEIYIEIKTSITTDLQESQLGTYPLKILKSNAKNKELIFLLPDNYIHEYEIKQANKKYSFIRIIHWKDFLARINGFDICYGNSIVSESIKFIEESLKQSDINTCFNAREIVEMINAKGFIATIGTLSKLKEIIKQSESSILNELGKDYSASTWQMDIGNDDFGKYLDYKNKPFAFYGFNTSIINSEATNSKYLFSLAINKSVLTEKKLVDNDFEYLEDSEWYYLPLNIEILTEENPAIRFANDVSAMIKKIIKAI